MGIFANLMVNTKRGGESEKKKKKLAEGGDRGEKVIGLQSSIFEELNNKFFKTVFLAEKKTKNEKKVQKSNERISKN